MAYGYFHNGRIFSLDPQGTVHHSMLTLKEYIIAFDGLADTMARSIKPDLYVNLHQQTVLPGFIDCHTHLATYGFTLQGVNLRGVDSLGEALGVLNQYRAGTESKGWITGTGWNRNRWTDGEPDRHVLDQIFPDQPVALHNQDIHTLWVNSAALKIAGLLKPLPVKMQVKIDCDDAGMPTGLIFEDAQSLVLDHIPAPQLPQYQQVVKLAAASFTSRGITSVHSCEDMQVFAALQRIRQKDKLPIRVCMHPPASDVDDLIAAGLVSGFGDHWLRLGGIKFFVDGSLGSQTAEMFDSYENTDNSGISILTEKELREQVGRCAGNGLSATIHAIGDKANHKALNAIAAVQSSGPSGLRHRIEHAQTILPHDVQRFAGLGVIPSVQPAHIALDVRIAEKYLGDRCRTTYPLRSFVQSGARMVFGSDAPVVDPDPLQAIYSAVARKYDFNKQEESWIPEQTISVQQAVAAFTRDAARASYEEHLKGTLEVGKLADFIVLDSDIFYIPLDDIPDVRIKQTVSGGQIVFEST